MRGGGEASRGGGGAGAVHRTECHWAGRMVAARARGRGAGPRWPRGRDASPTPPALLSSPTKWELSLPASKKLKTPQSANHKPAIPQPSWPIDRVVPPVPHHSFDPGLLGVHGHGHVYPTCIGPGASSLYRVSPLRWHRRRQGAGTRDCGRRKEACCAAPWTRVGPPAVIFCITIVRSCPSKGGGCRYSPKRTRTQWPYSGRRPCERVRVYDGGGGAVQYPLGRGGAGSTTEVDLIYSTSGTPPPVTGSCLAPFPRRRPRRAPTRGAWRGCPCS